MKKVMVLSILMFAIGTSSAYAKEDITAWTLFNHGANSAKGKIASYEADSNNAWAMFNTGTKFWKKEGQILPEQSNGVHVRVVKTKNGRSFN